MRLASVVMSKSRHDDKYAKISDSFFKRKIIFESHSQLVSFFGLAVDPANDPEASVFDELGRSLFC